MELTQEYIKSILHYDPDNGVFRWRITTGRARTGAIAGSRTTRGYTRVNIGGAEYRAHRLAWLYVYGRWPREEIDHINGKKSDNRLDNLREAARIDNAQNMPRLRTNTSGKTGVHFNARNKKWVAVIMAAGKSNFLGSYASKDTAIAARTEAEIRYGFHPNHGRHRN